MEVNGVHLKHIFDSTLFLDIANGFRDNHKIMNFPVKSYLFLSLQVAKYPRNFTTTLNEYYTSIHGLTSATDL